MEYTVYAISSLAKNYIYVGFTSNVEERFKRHSLGYEPTTKPYRPFILLYTEICQDRKTARSREKYWKSGVGKEILRSKRDDFHN